MIRAILLIACILISKLLSAQDKLIAPEMKQKLDSLSAKIMSIENYIDENSTNRNAQYFYMKRELGLLRFVREYEELIYDENLVEAQLLIESRLKAAKKIHDNYAVDYFTSYNSKLTEYRQEKQRQYQKLFAKEKIFKASYENYIDPITEYSLERAERMINLAINYAKKNNRVETLKYLDKYRNYNNALKLDLRSTFDLEELTDNRSKFTKEFEYLLESDSLKHLKNAALLIEECVRYSYLALTEVDSIYFKKQRNVAANAITDWNSREGMNTDISTLVGGNAVIAKYDTINKEGIYKWNQSIVVIGNVQFQSSSEMVRRGQAIAAADRVIFEYIRLNRISDLKPKDQVAGTTILLPYNEDGKMRYYKFNQLKNKYQYMVCYRSIIDEDLTIEISKYLPPLQFVE